MRRIAHNAPKLNHGHGRLAHDCNLDSQVSYLNQNLKGRWPFGSSAMLANWLVKKCPNLQSDQPVLIELAMAKRVLAAELGTVSETLS
jgi:hypothetical protein